ncbi:nuclear receptor subfamily 1 group I member 3 [Microcaecilia unicolor]|uniref:Nuclear receptor subfamily 1 group I member 3 n=1 Tax=Microcaecilia unicolor TaxID=1415580 RepID=A0A6P7WLN4_9AMPH|nr:nuclear receptor subfamily 1 group I member 3 [Microcaecilia unicolor]XP_030044213.1 nuclear receptor subfamily 1 group I member 3 [Microcaecilia unicolor]XP_030044214.1 nuclear receptor subfamily 1 group I member 3 [Microcaecilia unicolor]XP_030044215.1 nuclear receptor subfamily 1 group I member 3 [Microcaecilia unicolor]
MLRLGEEDSDSSFSSTSVLSHVPSESEETEPEGEEKICTVCGDKASGYHFHVMTCEGCKGFFRRSISKRICFTCPFSQNCVVTKAKRRQCQACRLQKCLDAGMRKDMIMSDEALLMRRTLRNRKKQERFLKVQQAATEALTDEQQQLIQLLVDAHNRNIDSSFSKFIEFRPPDRLLTRVVKSRACFSPVLTEESPSPPCSETFWEGQESPDYVVSPEAFSMLPHFTDISTFMIQQIVKFAKEIPDFRSLPIDDQIALLKGATLEVGQLQTNTVFNEQTLIWECGQISYSIEDGILIGYQKEYLEPAIKFNIKLRKLRLHTAEYVLLEAIALFSPDRSGVTERDLIDKIQEKMAVTLKCYIDQNRPHYESRFLYAKLLSLLTELRSLTMESTRQIFHIQHKNNFVMAPLLKEIVS